MIGQGRKTHHHDVVVIGAGPAGSNAALALASAGIDVLVLDEAQQPGGQVWRAPSVAASRDKLSSDSDFKRGEALRKNILDSGIAIWSSVSVWSVVQTVSGYEIALAGERGPELITSERLVVASGAQERVVPFEGWTTPGVFGLAAATVLLKAETMLAGEKIVVAGQGPLLVAVAAKAVSLGKPPVAVIDYNPFSSWVRSVPGFMRQADALLQGMGWRAKLIRAGVPYLYSHEIARADHSVAGCLESVTVRPVGRDGQETTYAADVAYVGNGLVPGDEIVRLLGADQSLDAKTNTWCTRHDGMGRTSVDRLYVAGDSAAIRGGMPAAIQGKLVGMAVASDCGAVVPTRVVTSSKRALARINKFSDASTGLMRVDDARIEVLDDSVVLCRCEDVTVGAARKAIAEGACDANQLKHFTRLGMGPCQGRMCGANAGALLRLSGKIEPGHDRLTPRSPIRPVPVPDMAGQFDYADIPVPKPAPL